MELSPEFQEAFSHQASDHGAPLLFVEMRSEVGDTEGFIAQHDVERRREPGAETKLSIRQQQDDPVGIGESNGLDPHYDFGGVIDLGGIEHALQLAPQ